MAGFGNRRRLGGGITHRLGLLAAVSVAAGVVVAGMLTPVVGGIGLAAQRGINSWDRLPSAINIPPLPVASKIYTANGHLMATFYYEDRIPVTLAQVPEIMQKAIISIEDSRFYAEQGLDLKGLLRAAVNNISGGARQGGSTLTQQYVKNILLDEATTPQQRAAATADTISRKIREARYAIALAKKLSKAQILEGYLNIAYFGDGAYGIGAAAEHYYGVPVQNLTLPQAALLAGIVEDPSLYDPALHPVHAKDRRDVVLARMAQLGAITPAEASSAQATPVKLKLTVQRNGCVGTAAPYFCDYVVHDILLNPAFGPNQQARAQLLERGGLSIVTTMDPTTQIAAQNVINQMAPWNGSVGAVEAMVQPGTGAIRAIAVNQRYGPAKGQNSIDWAADASHGTSEGFQSGSTFKLFVLANALQQGIPLSTSFNSPPVIGPLTGYTDCQGDSLTYPVVQNSSAGEGGVFNIYTGTWASVNTFYAQLERRTGLCGPATLAGQVGLTQASGAPIKQVPSMVLGANNVSPLDMADAYATFAANGLYCPLYAISSVTDSTGHRLTIPHKACRQVVPPGLAATVTSVLTGVLSNPIGTAYGLGLPGRPAAGKTGTIDQFHDAWFIGYTPQLASAVWVGFPNQPNRSLIDVTIGGRFYGSPIFGATLPAPIWQATMEAALSGAPVLSFPPPDPKYLHGAYITIPNVAGKSPQAAVAALTSAGLIATVAPGTVNSSEPAGTVANTTPAAGTSITVGSGVTVFISNGKAPKKPPGPSPSPTKPGPSPTPGRRGHH